MRNSIIGMSLLGMLAGCRNPGLPPEPPEQDATNPEAGLVEVRSQSNPFTRSAFEGVKLDGAGGHEHHHHHGHGAKPAAAKEPAEAEAKPESAEAPAKASPGSHAHGGRS
jgi:hypothetical protein